MEEGVNRQLAAMDEFEEQLLPVKRKRSRVPKIPGDRALLADWWRKVLGAQGVNGAVLARVVAEGLQAERPIFGPKGEVVWAPDHGVRRQYFVEAAKVMGLYPDEQDVTVSASAGGVVVRMTPGLQGLDIVDGEVLDAGEGSGGEAAGEAEAD